MKWISKREPSKEGYDEKERKRNLARIGMMWAVVESACHLFGKDTELLDKKLSAWFKGEKVDALLPDGNEHIPKVEFDLFWQLDGNRTMTILRLIEILRLGSRLDRMNNQQKD